jgi:predicted dehydrogenase
VLVRNRVSVISAGTERSKIELGRKNIFEKARARPDLVRQTVDKARSEGVSATLAIVRDRLAGLTPIGYSSAGVVVEVGEGVAGLAPGDRVACGGAGWANHSELVAVPKNLVARVPDHVDFDAAAYATIGSIALHAVHQSDARLGEQVGVIGLGLVGQLALRILAAAGCKVVGIDTDGDAVELGRSAGATTFLRRREGLERVVVSGTGDGGLDAVIICAATGSRDPVDLACRLLRPRGTIVVVGEVPVEADRGQMYDKELELRLSRSYGPGRYSADYEEHGADLPVEYVRWTEQRNLQAFVDLIAAGRLDPSPLTTHRFPIDAAEEAYGVVESAGQARAFGVLLDYPDDAAVFPAQPVVAAIPRHQHSARIGVIGAGSFSRSIAIPQLSDAGATLAAVASDGGLSAADAAARFGFERALTAEQIIADDRIDAVVIATRHDSHAALTSAALRAGKRVFVEKPLALSWDELLDVELALADGGSLMVGFNRRFARFTASVSDVLRGARHRSMSIRVNAGALPDDHWLHDPKRGGGRLLGEGCHFIDLLMHCMGTRVAGVHAIAAPQTGRPLHCAENFVVSLRFADGSIGSLLYSSEGDPSLGKERIEAFAAGQSVVVDDFRRLERYANGHRSTTKGRRDKGHRTEMRRFLAVCRGVGDAPDPGSALASTQVTLAARDSLMSGEPVMVA